MKRDHSVENIKNPALIWLFSLMTFFILAGPAVAGTITQCNQCHGMPPLDAAYRNISTGAFQGNHQPHLPASVTASNCVKCHQNSSNNVLAYDVKHATTNNLKIQIANNVNTSPATGQYLVGGSPITFKNQTSVPILGSCSNVNCHFEQTTPTWGGAAFIAPADCGSCHGAPPSDGSHPAASGPGLKHGNYYTTTTTSCVYCHPARAGFAHATSAANRALILSFAAAPNTGTGTYSKAINLNYPNYLPSQTSAANRNGYCSNIYCHSDGTKASATFTVMSTPQWGSALSCKSCHGYTAASGSKAIGVAVNSTSKHTPHINNSAVVGKNIGCQECHNATTTNGTTITTLANHVDKNINIKFDNLINLDNDKPHYNNMSTSKLNGAVKAPGPIAAIGCVNVYCHSNGVTNSGSPTFKTVTWSDPAWIAGQQCTYCHGTQGSKAHNTVAGSHATHVEYRPGAADGFVCANCHNKTTADTAVYPALPTSVIVGGSHLGRSETISLANIQSAGTNFTNMTGSYSLGPKSCSSNVYCHSSGANIAGSKAPNKVAVWSSGRMYCKDCHSGAQNLTNNATNVMNTGAHSRHVNPAINTELGTGNGFMCAECHAKTASFANNTTLVSKAFHVNKFRDYSGPRANKNYNSTTFQCSNVYCHSNGEVGVTPAVAAYSNPANWYSGTANQKCNYCHGTQGQLLKDAGNTTFTGMSSLGAPNYQTQGIAVNGANSHAGHVAAGANNSSNCYPCHRRTVDSSSAAAAKFRAYSSKHANGSTDVAFSPAIGGTYNPAVGTKQCSSVVCHGSGTLQWGKSTTNGTCTKCHGKGTVLASYSSANAWQAAPGYATTGTDVAGQAGTFTGGVSNDVQVGAHDAHVRALNNYASKVSCSNCHGTLPTSGTHANGTTNMSWSKLATYSSALVPSYTVGSGTACSNTYCHGNAFVAAVKGANTAPNWTDGSYLANPASAKNATDCNKCHQSPPTASVKFDHSATAMPAGLATDCSGCHNHNGGNDPRHIDGILEAAGGCNGCHDYDTVGATYSGGIWTGGTWGKNSKDGLTPNQGWGAHAQHINYIKTRLGIATALSPDSQTFGVGVPANVCGTCHTNLAGNHSTGGSTVRTISFGDATFKMGGASGTSLLFGTTFPAQNPVYSGTSGISSAATAKTCANLSCHYSITPVWSTY